MSDSTPITQGLRERLRAAALGLVSPTFEGLLAECDNVDTIHNSLEDEYAEMREFCDRLKDAVNKRGDVTLFGVDYKALPLGADGVSINVGDKGTVHNGNGIHEVKQLVFEGNCWWIGCKMEMAFGTVKRMPSSFRHRKPTVTDLLRELVDGIKDQNEDFTELIIKEYAKCLQLAEVDE